MSTSIDSISFGSRDMSGLVFGSRASSLSPPAPCSAGRPSITYNGSLFALIDPVPRTRTRMPTPGIPEFDVTCTPAILPCRPPDSVTVGAALVSNWSPDTDDTAPVRSRFSTVA